MGRRPFCSPAGAAFLTRVGVLFLLVGGAVVGLILRIVPRACLLTVVVLVGFVAVWGVFVVINDPSSDPECGHTLLNLLPCTWAGGITEAAFVAALGLGAGYALGAAGKGGSPDDRDG
jgi:hypothetical protein